MLSFDVFENLLFYIDFLPFSVVVYIIFLAASERRDGFYIPVQAKIAYWFALKLLALHVEWLRNRCRVLLAWVVSTWVGPIGRLCLVSAIHFSTCCCWLLLLLRLASIGSIFQTDLWEVEHGLIENGLYLFWSKRLLVHIVEFPLWGWCDFEIFLFTNFFNIL